MAITGAVTLAHLAKVSNRPLEKGIIRNLLRYSKMLDTLPFRTVDQLTVTAVRQTSLPSAAFRKLNAGYTASVGDTEQVTENIYPVGGEFNIDRVYDKIGNLIIDPRVQQIMAWNEAIALKLNDTFINGDHASDPDTFEGLKKRAAGMPSRQSVYFAGSSSAALDPTASIANARAFMDKLDECWYKTNSGNVSAIYANEGMKWGLQRVYRYAQTSAGAGVFDVTKDTFDRDVLSYKGVPVMDVGLKPDQSTEIITDSETAGDAGADATSIYFASFDMKEGLTGIQLSPLEVYDPLTGGEKEGTPTGMVRLEWVLGLANFGSRGIVRGQNVEGASNWT